MQSDDQKPAEELELDPDSMDAIRNLLADNEDIDEAPSSAPGRRDAPQQGVADRVEPDLPPRKADGLPDIAAVPPQLPEDKPAGFAPKARAQAAVSETRSHIGRQVDAAKARILGYRPTVKHILLASFALLVFMRPWLVVGLFFLMAFVVIGIFLILGYDGFWRRAMAIGRWYARRHPERSVELHRKLDQFAFRFDAFLDRFPEGSVDGLYLPDFGDVAEADARHAEAVDRRLASMKQSEA